jgi:hypothetical protein
MADQTVVQSNTANFGGTSATAQVVLTGVAAHNAIEVRIGTWGGNTQPSCTVSDGTNTYSLAARAANSAEPGSLFNSEIHYVTDVPAGTYTVVVTHPSGSGERYGWIWVGEIANRKRTGALISAAVGTNTGNSNTPTVAGAGATGEAAYISVALNVSGATADAGIDPCTGNSLTWTNRQRRQDAAAESGVSHDDAVAAATLTPSVGWGTLSATLQWAGATAAFRNEPDVIPPVTPTIAWTRA